MKTHYTTIIAALMAALVMGCSKSSVSQSQATTPANAAEAPASMTNTLDVLQARYQENQVKLSNNLSKLHDLLGSPNASQQQYLDLQTNIEQLIQMQKLLTNDIEAKKLNAQPQAQGTH